MHRLFQRNTLFITKQVILYLKDDVNLANFIYKYQVSFTQIIHFKRSMYKHLGVHLYIPSCTNQIIIQKHIIFILVKISI
jgi:hypothetical protein